MEIPLLKDIVIILGLSVGVIFLFQKLKLPTILGFLATGIIFGPYGLGLIQKSHEIEMLSEIGIILLLFIIGLEFSLRSLARIKTVVFIGGATQVLLTILIVFGVMSGLGYPQSEALFFGFLISLSSTAIVLSLLQSSGMISSPQGKIALGILIFQDIIVVPMMLITPMLNGSGGDFWLEMGLLVLKASGVIAAVLVSARYLVPQLLDQIVKTRSRELFIITIVSICFAVAWLTSSIGLSLALGAFMAGLTISESEYSHQATGLIIPFREIFTSFFFVSIGMLLDLSFFASNVLLILGLTVAIFLLKTLIVTGAARLLRYPFRTALLTGFSLFQVGEFSFILATVGLSANVLSEEPYQYFLSVSIITMGLTPFVIQYSEYLTTKFTRVNYTPIPEEKEDLNLSDHLVILGYGLNGKNMARIAKEAGIPYVIMDMNAHNVEAGKRDNEPIHFGDASNPYMLQHIHISKARVAVVAISDAPATKNIVTCIRNICNTVHIVVRSRFLNETPNFLKLGANEVISEEFETSMEIFTRVLHQYLVPEDDIHHYIHGVRDQNYKMLRPFFQGNHNRVLPNWSDLKVSALKVNTSDKDIVGSSLAEVQLRNKFGVSVMAIYRGEQIITTVTPDAQLKDGDLVYVFGSPEAIEAFGKAVR